VFDDDEKLVEEEDFWGDLREKGLASLGKLVFGL
jgi:hypothetical protein